MRNLRALAALMTPIQKGMKRNKVLSAERMQAWQDFMFALANGDNLEFPSSGGITKSPSGYSALIKLLPQRQLQQKQRTHPFQVVPATDEGNGPRLKVVLDSWLMGSMRASDKITITGLDAGFSIAISQFIYVKATVTEGEVTAASIEHGAAWDEYDENAAFEGEGDEREQTFAYRLIAYTQSYPGSSSAITGDPTHFPNRLIIPYDNSGSGALMQVVQCLTTNLIVQEECDEEGSRLGLFDHSAVPAPEP